MPEFDQAIAMFIWAWFIMSVIFTVASVRSSWTLLAALVFVDFTLILLAVGHMLGEESCLKAGSATGLVTAALACKSGSTKFSCLRHLRKQEVEYTDANLREDWAGTAGLWGDGTTPFNLPVGSLKKD